MIKQQLSSLISKVFFGLAVSLGSLQAFSDSIPTLEYSLATGDFFLTDINGQTVQGTGSGTTGGGEIIDPFAFDGSNSGVTGAAGTSLQLDVLGDDIFTGNASASAEVLDPFNRLSSVQADGESTINFGFKIFAPHTYTLTGSTSVTNGGSVLISFDSSTFTEVDGTFSLSGTLAAGTYNFDASSIAALGNIGTVSADYNFELQLNEISAVPVPAAVWLFASGLIGLFGFSRYKYK